MPDSGQSQIRKLKMSIYCSEMTINYIVMHCNTLHYTVEYTATYCSQFRKPNEA